MACIPCMYQVESFRKSEVRAIYVDTSGFQYFVSLLTASNILSFEELVIRTLSFPFETVPHTTFVIFLLCSMRQIHISRVLETDLYF